MFSEYTQLLYIVFFIDFEFLNCTKNTGSINFRN